MKIDKLVDVLPDDTVIVTDKPTITEIFLEIDERVSKLKGPMKGVFRSEHHPVIPNTRSVMRDGKTIHFMTTNNLLELIKNLEKTYRDG